MVETAAKVDRRCYGVPPWYDQCVEETTVTVQLISCGAHAEQVTPLGLLKLKHGYTTLDPNC